MAFVNDPTDPTNMTPEARVAEIAAILAEGVLRLRRRTAIPQVSGDVSPLKISLESGPVGLDVCPEIGPHGHRG